MKNAPKIISLIFAALYFSNIFLCSLYLNALNQKSQNLETKLASLNDLVQENENKLAQSLSHQTLKTHLKQQELFDIRLQTLKPQSPQFASAH